MWERAKEYEKPSCSERAINYKKPSNTERANTIEETIKKSEKGGKNEKESQ